jgi:hypothetical protein
VRGVRRTDAEIAASYEAKAKKLREKSTRREAKKGSKLFRKIDSTIKALAWINDELAKIQGPLPSVAVTQDDLQRALDKMVGRTRIDDPA